MRSLAAAGRLAASVALGLGASVMCGCSVLSGYPWGWHRLIYEMPQRPPVRAELSQAEYAARAAELRAAYIRPPAEWPPPVVDATVLWAELGPLPAVEYPASNPYSPEKAQLGRMLFFEPRLSGSGRVACTSCHVPDKGWADDRRVSVGHRGKRLRRNTPSVLNAGQESALFWDGRAHSLEEQAGMVLTNPDEMGADEAMLEQRLEADPVYASHFAAAFGDRAVTLGRITEALACFERTLVGGRSRFDRFLRGERGVLTDAEIRGLHLFRTSARCLNCHHGPNLTDDKLHVIGLSRAGKLLFEDLGRYTISQDLNDLGRFRTPSLRNVGRTPPYMHSGLYQLSSVLKLYNDGMPVQHAPRRWKDGTPAGTSALLRPLGLNRHDPADLEAFLRALDEPVDESPAAIQPSPQRSAFSAPNP